MRHLHATVAALAALSIFDPVPAGAGAPRWCAGYTPSRTDTNVAWVKTELRKPSPFNLSTLVAIAKATCDKPGDPEREQLFAEWRSQYQKAAAATEADFDELMAYVMKNSAERHKLEHQQCDALKPDGELDPDRKADADAVASLVGCSPNGARNAYRELMWWLDRPEVTEVQRAILIHTCISDLAVAQERLHGEFAYCWVDLGKLDRARFDKELAGLKLNEHGRVMAVSTFGEAKVKAEDYVAKYKKLAAKDPSWKRLLEAPQAGWDAWFKQRDQNKAAYDAVLAFREKLASGSKKEVAGCDQQLRKLLFARMLAKKPASIAETGDAAKEPAGYELAVALQQCYSAQGRFLEASTLGEVFFSHGATRHHRGPRSGSYYATLETLNTIREDRASFPLGGLPGLPSGGTSHGTTIDPVQHGMAQGQIAKVTPRGSTTTVSFKTVRWKDPTYDCKATNRIERIAEDGNVVYEQNCKLTGYENKSSTEAPIEVPSELAGGLKPGQMAIFSLNTKDGKRAGIPTGVFADANKKKVLGLFGVFW